MKVAVVGIRHGHALSLAKTALQHPDVELIALVEEDASLVEQFRAIADVPVYPNLEQLLSVRPPDAAILGPVNSRKAEAMIALLERGVHLLIDKPLLTRMEDLLEVERALARSAATLYLALTMRFSPSFIGAQRFVAAGGIGAVVNCFVQGPHKLRPQTRPSWMLNDVENGGAIVDLGSHQVDLIRWFTGAEVAEITAYASNSKFPELAGFTDNGAMLIRMTDGSTAFLRTDWMTPSPANFHSDYRLMITGTKGMIEVRHGPEDRIICATESSPAEEVLPVAPPRSLMHDFIDAARGSATPLLTAKDAIEATRATLIARQSALEGRTLPVR